MTASLTVPAIVVTLNPISTWRTKAADISFPGIRPDAILIGSDEYFALHGSNNEGFLDALYEDALNRAPDAGGMSGFGQALAGGMSRGQVASLVQSNYQGLLGRDVDPAGLAGWLQFLQQGGTDQAMAAFFLGLTESYAKRS